MNWPRQRWSNFDPAIQKALDTPDSACKWRMAVNTGVPPWSHVGGKVLLLGDAVLGMTPFSGQSSAMSIEDFPGGVPLSSVLAGSHSGDDLNSRQGLCERTRRPRVERVQKMATAVGQAWGHSRESVVVGIKATSRE